MRKRPRFGTVARQQQAQFRTTLSPASQHASDDIGIRNRHLVAIGHEIENLGPELRGPSGALAFFGSRGIKWWTSARSGDQTAKDGYRDPTRNLASSQVSCINFVLWLAQIPGALAECLRCIDNDVEDIVNIVDRGGRSSPVEFEWVGWNEPLEGGRITRGAYQTSIDALIVARTVHGRRAYLLEWKYCEEYLNPNDKGRGSEGQTRRSRYHLHYERPESSFNQVAPLNDFFFEPFYQIMRQCLLADKMLMEGITPYLAIDEAKVIVVCPTANLDYRMVVKTTPMGLRFHGLDTVQDVIRATLTNPDVFSVVAQEDLTAKLRASDLAPALGQWLDYHELRYGW